MPYQNRSGDRRDKDRRLPYVNYAYSGPERRRGGDRRLPKDRRASYK